MTTVERQLEEFASSYGCYIKLNNRMYLPNGVYPLSYFVYYQNEIVFGYNVHEQKYTIYDWKNMSQFHINKIHGGGFDARLRAYIPVRIKEIDDKIKEMKQNQYKAICTEINKDFE